jgi:hypothetical protein
MPAAPGEAGRCKPSVREAEPLPPPPNNNNTSHTKG